jgi:hypothetical protein
MRTRLIVAVLVFSTSLLPPTAHAQLFRAYLASDGSDANPCTLPLPCRLLPAALNAVAYGGEVWILDSANFNTATAAIDKSVTILAIPGAVGSILAIGGPGVSITAGGLVVTLRNLVIAPLAGGGGTNGVSMTGGSHLTVEDCLIAGMPGNGVYVIGSGTVRVVGSTIRNSTSYGVWVQNGATGHVSDSRILENQGGGVVAYVSSPLTTTVTVSDSVISGGADGAFALTNIAGAVGRVSVTRSTIGHTTNALVAQTVNDLGSPTVTVGRSMITNNMYGWRLIGLGAVVRTLGNNHFGDNLTNDGSMTLFPLQ